MNTSRRAVLSALAAVAAAPLVGATPALAVEPQAPTPTLPQGTSTKKVLIVGMDGLRHDRIDAANAPNLKAMMANGTYGTSLIYGNPPCSTSSGPGWSTVHTGVWPDKHGVLTSTGTNDFATYKPLFARLAEVRPNLSTYAAVDWLPLDTAGIATSGVDGKNVYNGDDGAYPTYDSYIANHGESVLADQNPDVLFIYFGGTDIAAHQNGVLGQAYLDAIAVQDGYLGRLLAAINARPTYASEEWTVIVTNDHGHKDTGGHGGTTIEERRVFVLAQGPGIPAAHWPIDIKLVDVAPTVFTQLNIPINPAWQLDGKPVQQRSSDPFDALHSSLAGRIDETDIPAEVRGYTHTPPPGWSIDNSQMGTGGVAEWAGWTFTTDEFWTRAQSAQHRESNYRSRGVFAVADSDEWTDNPFTGIFDSTLTTPSYAAAGKTQAIIRYMTHYRQHGTQTADVRVSFDNGPATVVKSHTTNQLAKPQKITVAVPAGTTQLRVSFRYTGNNNWYWVIDDVRVTLS